MASVSKFYGGRSDVSHWSAPNILENLEHLGSFRLPQEETFLYIDCPCQRSDRGHIWGQNSYYEFILKKVFL